MEHGRDEKGPYMQMNCGIDDIRLMYTGINFYLENWPGPEDCADASKELDHLKSFHHTLYSMILEYNFHK